MTLQPSVKSQKMFFFQELLAGNILYKNIPTVKNSKSDTIKLIIVIKLKDHY